MPLPALEALDSTERRHECNRCCPQVYEATLAALNSETLPKWIPRESEFYMTDESGRSCGRPHVLDKASDLLFIRRMADHMELVEWEGCCCRFPFPEKGSLRQAHGSDQNILSWWHQGSLSGVQALDDVSFSLRKERFTAWLERTVTVTLMKVLTGWTGRWASSA
jgi:hypothetical protein